MRFPALRSFIILILVSIFYLLPSAAYANTTPQTNNYPVANTNPNVPNNLHNWTQNVMIEVMSALTCQITGVDPINPKQGCLGVDQLTGKIGFLPKAASPDGALAKSGGAIGFMGNMITTLYTPPLHTSDYFKDLAQNFGITKKTYAQQTGTGFQSLTPLISIWSAFRNIVYLILVIVFVVIGLAIMLRVKIDPRTVMTIQNQIPRIIVGILAVTFSFAIAGFLIDMMWVLIYLSYGIFSTIPGFNAVNFNPVGLQGQSVLQAAGHISAGGAGGIAAHIASDGTDIINKLLGIAPNSTNINPFSGDIKNPLDFFGWLGNFTNIIGFGFNLDPISWLINSISAGLSLAYGFKFLDLPPPSVAGISLGFAGNIIHAVPAMLPIYTISNLIMRLVLPFLIIYLIIFIALLTALFRLWFMLLTAYVYILLDVVLAPFWIIGGIVPGSQISLSGWLKDIGANLLAFPVVIAMFMLGNVFLYSFGNTQTTGQFVPPLIGNPTTTDAIGSLIGFGIILITPNVVNLLKQMVKAPKIDTDVGKSIAGATGVFTGTTKKGIGAGATAIYGDPFDTSGAKGFKAIFSSWRRRN